MRHWKCIEVNCSAKFIRRGYLLDHLTYVHKYSRSDARNATLNAKRENQKQSTGYYEQVSSSDDEIFDILAETEELNKEHDTAIKDFDTDLFENSVDSDGSVIQHVQSVEGNDNVGDINDQCANNQMFSEDSGDSTSDSGTCNINQNVSVLSSGAFSSVSVGSSEKGKEQCEKGSDSEPCAKLQRYSDISSDSDITDEDESVIYVGESTDTSKLDVDKIDKNIHYVIEYTSVVQKTKYTYRGDEIIHTEQYCYGDRWTVRK